MLEILLIASGAFFLSMFCVWVYRAISSWNQSRYRTVRLKGQGGGINVGREQGTVQLRSKIGLATGNGSDSRKPWGW